MSRLRSRSEGRRVGAKSEGRLGGMTCLSACGGRARRQGGGGDCPFTPNVAPGISRWSTASSRPSARQKRSSSPPMPNGSGSHPASGMRDAAALAIFRQRCGEGIFRRPIAEEEADARALCGPRRGRRQRARGSGARARLWHVLPTGGVNVALRLPTAPTRGSTKSRGSSRQRSSRQGLSPGSNGKAAGLQFRATRPTAVLETGTARAQDGKAPLAPFRRMTGAGTVKNSNGGIEHVQRGSFDGPTGDLSRQGRSSHPRASTHADEFNSCSRARSTPRVSRR